MGRRVLNSQDRAVLVTDRFLVSKGHPGMQVQVQLWFESRIDEGRLRRCLREIARVHPVVTSRFRRAPRFKNSYWSYPVGDEPEFRVEHLPDDDESTVRERAGRGLSRPMDLERDPPVRFVVLRRPSTGDVLLLQYSHVLMDGKASERLLEQMAAIDRGREVESRSQGETDELMAWYREYPLSTRLRIWGRNTVNRVKGGRNRGGESLLRFARPEAHLWSDQTVRIATRSLDASERDRIRHRARSILGFENLIPVFVASALRSVDRVATWDERPDAPMSVAIMLSARSFTNRAVPIVCNFVIPVGFRTTRDGLDDRDELIQILSGQMRSRLRNAGEIGLVDVIWWLGRGDQRFRLKLLERFWHPTTMGFAYLGAMSEEIRDLFGSRVQRFYNLIPTVSVANLSITELDGLHVALTYTDDILSEEVVETFLDRFVADLRA